MESRTEQVNIIHSMCWKEINVLKMNLDKLIIDSERCQKLLNEFVPREGVTNIFGLILYDRYTTQMLSALNMARKFNIHLEMNNLAETVINSSTNECFDNKNFAQTRLINDMLEWRITSFENSVVNHCENKNCIEGIKISEDFNEINKTNEGCLKTTCKNYDTAIEKMCSISFNLNNLLENLLPTKSFDKFVTDFEFEARIVHVQDYKNLEFFICLNNDQKTLYHLSCVSNFNILPCELLSLDDMFCVIEIDDNEREYLLRAVFIPEERENQTRKLIYLVDFGEAVYLTEKFKTYLAPPQLRQIPPLAIKCILEGFEDFSFNCIKDQTKCEEVLQNIEYGKAFFRVIFKKERTLHVVMLKTIKDDKNIYIKSNSQTNPFRNLNIFDNNDQNSSTNSELQLPSSIFYDTSLIKQPVTNITTKIGHKIQVMVTHIVNPISFYGIIQKNFCENDKSFSWNDRQVLSSQKEIISPKLHDIVLSQYTKDGYWYRAKIIDIDFGEQTCQVFYVDFGNAEYVPSNSLAKCSEEQLQDPFRAVLFQLANLSITSEQYLEQANLKIVIENLVVMILDQTVTVEVANIRNDILVVSLIDHEFAKIPKMLIDSGVAEEI